MTGRSFACHVIAASLLLVACGNDSASLLTNVHTLEAKGDYAAAIAEISRGLRADPSNGVLHYHRGRIHGLMFDSPTAEHEFRRASQFGTVEGGRVALGLGRALLQQRKYKEVVADVVAAPAFEQGIRASVHAVRGHALMSLNRIGEARKELEAAASLDPTNADAVLLQAQFTAGGRDVEGALRLIEKLLAQDSRNVDAWIHRANLLTIMGKPREALASFAKAIEIQPQHLQALVGRAITLVQVGRLIDAQKDVDSLRKAYPKKPDTAYLRGQIHYWRGEYREALDMAQGMLKADHEHDAARLLSGMSNLMLNAPSQAEQELARYAAAHPHNDFARRVLVDLRAEVSRKGDVKALASLHADEFRKASVQAIFGDAYVRVWQYSKIAAWLERAAGMELPDPLNLVRHAKRRFSQEQLESAISDLERVVALNDGITAADKALILALLARGEGAKAADAVTAMAKKSPDNPQAAALAGVVALERYQYADAGQRFDEALERDPKLIAAVVGRASVDIAARKLDLARKRFEDALKVDPDQLLTLVVYAQFESASRRRTEAHVLLSRAIRAHPAALQPRVILVGLLKDENDKARALSVAEEMIAAHPNDPVAIEMTAHVLLWSGDQDRGLATLGRLVKVLPRSPESYYKLAAAQFQAGHKVEAQENLYKALALPINDPEPPMLTVSGLMDDTKTLDAIESARKSYKVRYGPNDRMLVEGGASTGQIGGSALYDALLSGGGRGK